MRWSARKPVSSSRRSKENGPCLYKMKLNPKGTFISSCRKKLAFWTCVSPHQLPCSRSFSISRVSTAALLNLFIAALLFLEFDDLLSVLAEPLCSLVGNGALCEHTIHRNHRYRVQCF